MATHRAMLGPTTPLANRQPLRGDGYSGRSERWSTCRPNMLDFIDRLAATGQ